MSQSAQDIATLLHEKMLTAALARLESDDFDSKDLEVIRKILSDQGVSCIGENNKTVQKSTNILSQLPIKVVVDNTRGK
jgi:hypothetical protein